MLRNYLKIAFRSLLRSKVHSMINILGLGLGISVCILIVLFVRDEWTFDTFHTKANRIYRVYAREDWGENQQFFGTTTPFPMGPALKDNFPEVEMQVRFNNLGSLVKVGENQFTETVSIGGVKFFEVFDFDGVYGDKNKALDDQTGVVLTRATAVKYFGEGDPTGKPLAIQLGQKFEDFTVKAVIEDIPTNSSLRFGILISELNYPKLYSERTLTSAWFNIAPETYVLLREGVDAKTIESKFPSVFKTILGEERYNKSKYAPGLQPLTDIHLNTSFPVGIAPVSNPRYAYILAAISLLILFVACINFVTLAVGRSMKRAKEVGIRKVVGAERRQLIFQFIGEAVIVTVTSLVVGLVLAVAGLPLFNDLANKQLTLRPDLFTAGVMASLVAVIGLIAGSYPAFVLSNFKPIAILKGSIQSGNNKQGMRKMLVAVQLVLSIFLISSTLVMKDQLEFLRSKDLGFNQEQLAVVSLNVPRVGQLSERIKIGLEKAEQFKTELAKVAGIASVAVSGHDFGKGAWTAVGYTDDAGVYRTFMINIVDENYIASMGMEMVTGRPFTRENTSDSRRAIIVNEAFVKEYGWKDPLGKRIPGKKFADHEIIGVVKDFNYASLYSKVAPLVMAMDPALPTSGIENIDIDNSPFPKLMIRLRPGDMQSTIEQIKLTWDRLTNGEEFSFDFVDQALATQYRNDQNLGKIVSIATALAIIIGSLGLYALASLAMQNRTKEISIRKVMGASEQTLLVLLSKDYVALIGISLLLSIPLTYYAMDKWLMTFEYRVGIGWTAFALAGGISLLVAMLTISYQAVKTAWTRPAETLKYE
ncbi:MAG TPA: ABC transporter permease [Cyclobacteriaceae bacterium]|nr:ABC transporter permease [Cyclobacteriaceae bacterium]